MCFEMFEIDLTLFPSSSLHLQIIVSPQASSLPFSLKLSHAFLSRNFLGLRCLSLHRSSSNTRKPARMVHLSTDMGPKRGSITQDDEQQRYEEMISRHLQLLVHSSTCIRPGCIPNCQKMKELLQHFTSCHLSYGECKTCRKINLLLNRHARECKVVDCKAIKCKEIQEVLMASQVLVEMKQGEKDLPSPFSFICGSGSSSGSSLLPSSSSSSSSSSAVDSHRDHGEGKSAPCLLPPGA